MKQLLLALAVPLLLACSAHASCPFAVKQSGAATAPLVAENPGPEVQAETDSFGNPILAATRSADRAPASPEKGFPVEPVTPQP